MSTRKSAFDFFFFKIMSGSKMLVFEELRCVTTVIPWLSLWRLPSNVRYVTCSHGTDCHAESPAGRVQCLKMAKIDPVHLFTPLFDWKMEFCNGKTYKKYKKTSLLDVNIYFWAFRNWKCLLNYRRPTMKIPELRWCLTEITFNNRIQFPGMF